MNNYRSFIDKSNLQTKTKSTKSISQNNFFSFFFVVIFTFCSLQQNFAQCPYNLVINPSVEVNEDDGCELIVSINLIFDAPPTAELTSIQLTITNFDGGNITGANSNYSGDIQIGNHLIYALGVTSGATFGEVFGDYSDTYDPSTGTYSVSVGTFTIGQENFVQNPGEMICVDFSESLVFQFETDGLTCNHNNNHFNFSPLDFDISECFEPTMIEGMVSLDCVDTDESVEISAVLGGTVISTVPVDEYGKYSFELAPCVEEQIEMTTTPDLGLIEVSDCIDTQCNPNEVTVFIDYANNNIDNLFLNISEEGCYSFMACPDENYMVNILGNEKTVTVSGNVSQNPICFSDSGSPAMEGVTIQVTDAMGNPVLDSDGNPIAIPTDANGNYSAEVAVCSGNYSLSVGTVCPEPCYEGLSTFDIILINQGVLGIGSIDGSETYLFAGDINGDGLITTFDLSCLRLHVLGAPQLCPSAVDNWCNFVPESVFLTSSLLSTNNVNYPNSIPFSSNSNHVNGDFVMFPIGDMNCDCTNPEYEQPPIVTDDPISITIDPTTKDCYDILIKERVDVELLALEFDLPNGTKMPKLESKNKVDWAYNIINRKLKVIGLNTTKDPITLSGDESAFRLCFDKPVDNLALDTKSYENLIMTRNGQVSLLEASNKNAQSSEIMKRLDIQSYGQDAGTIAVQIDADEESNSTIAIYDILGRPIQSTTVDLTKGNNNLDIPMTGSTGIYIISVQTGANIESQKFYWH